MIYDQGRYHRGSETGSHFIGSEANGQFKTLSILQRFYRQAPTAITSAGGSLGPWKYLETFELRSRPRGSHSLPQHNSVAPTSGIRSQCSCVCNRHADHTFIHWCIPETRYSTKMLPLRACPLQSDVDLFKSLRDNFQGGRHRFRDLFS
jgi:hypothetical protein